MEWLKIIAPIVMTSLIASCNAGCKSTQVALEGNAYVKDVQQTLWDKSERGLTIYIDKDTSHRLNAAKSNEERDEILVDYSHQWQTRMFWKDQWEKAKTYHLVTVEAKLISDKSIFENLWEWMTGTVDTGLAALATKPEVPTTQPAEQE